MHAVSPAVLEAMWGQFDVTEVPEEGLILALPQGGKPMPATVAVPLLPALLERDSERADYGTKDLRRGFSIDLWFRLDSLVAGQILVDNRSADGQGFCLQTTDRGTVEIVLHDGRTENRWDCDVGMIQAGKTHHLVTIVHGGPKIICFVVDGQLNDGGAHRQSGWGRYSPHLRGANASLEHQHERGDGQAAAGQRPQENGMQTLRIGPDLDGQVLSLRLYNRYLLTSEAIGNYRAETGRLG
jgi:hypothetical protein